MNHYIMSIKREYGLNLLNGNASWEYRKRKSLIKVGDKIILYATAPHSELMGEFIVGDIIIGSSEEVWEKTKEEVCYSSEEVIPYLKSGDYPIAFKVSQSKVYEPSIKISNLPFFKPPMSYCKAPEELLSKML